MIKATLLFIVLVVLVASLDQPRWNNRFSQEFEESFTYPILGTSKTTGTLYYDWDAKKYAVYRENGKRDRYCGLNGLYFFYNTPCTHYVENGIRYLHYPEYDYCCNCCSSQHGCDVLKPDWLDGAEFIGEVNFQNQSAYKWDKAGLQSNFYYETVHDATFDRRMLGIDQQPNDFQVFDAASYDDSFSEGLLSLPQSCDPNKMCSLASICTAVRYA